MNIWNLFHFHFSYSKLVFTRVDNHILIHTNYLSDCICHVHCKINRLTNFGCPNWWLEVAFMKYNNKNNNNNNNDNNNNNNNNNNTNNNNNDNNNNNNNDNNNNNNNNKTTLLKLSYVSIKIFISLTLQISNRAFITSLNQDTIKKSQTIKSIPSLSRMPNFHRNDVQTGILK